MAPIVISRPMLSIQCDWDEVLGVDGGNAWVSCKKFGSPSKHGKITCSSAQGDGALQVETGDGFTVENIFKKSITLLHEDPNCKCLFLAPEKSYSNIHRKSITSLDVTSKGLGVSVCSENRLLVWDKQNGSILRTLEGHTWDVYKCSFFPSGLVILSAGADMQLKIWSAETGMCPVTLRGHTAAITDTAIVDRGRNIVSVSKDGSARLWDCGESSCLDVIARLEGNINSCAISNVTIDLGEPENTPSEREIATEGKLLLLGCESGSFNGIGLHSRKPVFQFQCPSAVNCCCFISQMKVICGTQDGKLYQFDLSNTSEPSVVWEESASPVLCLLPLKEGFFAGRADGTCIFVPLTGDLTVQLTGSGFDPVYCIATDGSSIFTGCRDGLIRKYTIPNSVGIVLW